MWVLCVVFRIMTFLIIGLFASCMWGLPFVHMWRALAWPHRFSKKEGLYPWGQVWPCQFLLKCLCQARKISVMYLCDRNIDFASFCDFHVCFWELFRQCDILELFRQCDILELFRQCDIFCFSFYWNISYSVKVKH